MTDSTRISMDQLKVGLYIYLDMKWLDQPFAFGHFRIKNEDQIAVIRTLGLQTVRYNQSLSTTTPGPAKPSGAPSVGSPGTELEFAL